MKIMMNTAGDRFENVVENIFKKNKAVLVRYNRDYMFIRINDETPSQYKVDSVIWYGYENPTELDPQEVELSVFRCFDRESFEVRYLKKSNIQLIDPIWIIDLY